MFEVGQGAAGVEALVVGEVLAEVAGGAEGVGLPAVAVQGEHVAADQAFP